MKPIKFSECNCTFAENQPPYLPLPVWKSEDGKVISCWALSWRERVKVLWTGRVWWRMLTFNQPLQPQRPMVDNPFHVPIW